MIEILLNTVFRALTNMLISQHLPEIVRLISTNDVVSIVAATGSGKSVGVPAAIAATGARCFVTVPTRTAAISLAEYQRLLQGVASPGVDVNALVGYAAEGNINYSAATRIAYVTGGHARRKMLSYFSKGVASPINFCDVLMVDEVHSGSIDTTIIISLWMQAAFSGVLVPRLVIASATPVPLIIYPTPVLYTVEVAAFPIEYQYLDKNIDIDDPNGPLYNTAADLAAEIHRSTDVNTGHILIFAPGSKEVESVASFLRELLREPIVSNAGPPKTADIISAFGALKPEDLALIYKVPGDNERKIVIATNIAEMSITINDVGHVIDTMVEKRAETSQSGGFRLSTRYISKDSAKQRAGRTGRTRPGICYRLCTQDLYDSLDEHRPPEIERVPIYESVMELLDVGLSPETIIKGIDTYRVTQSIQLLSRIGMVTTDNGDINVTDMGHFAPKFHVSVRNAAFLWNWINSGYPIFPGIVTACLIDSYGPSYFWIPRKTPEMSMEEYNVMIKDYKAKYFSKFVGYNDLETCLNMWHDLMRHIGDIHPNQKLLINWSRENSINNKKIRELLTIVQRCVNSSNRLGYQVKLGPFTTDGVMKAARPILLSVYSNVTLIHSRDITYVNPVTHEDYRLDNRDAINNFASNPPRGIIALSTAEIKTQRGTFRVIGFGVDTEIDGSGKPITIKPTSQISRAPRAAPRSRQQSNTVVQRPNPVNQRGNQVDRRPNPVNQQVGRSDLNQALELLAGLNLGTPKTIEVERDTTIEALDLLATLANPILPPQNIQLVIPPISPPVIVPFPIITEIEQSNIAGTPDVSGTLNPVGDNITILPIDQASDQQLIDLSVIGSDPSVYTSIGEGNPWTEEYARQLKTFAIDDALRNNRQYLHWIILNNNVVTGYVGIHPVPSDSLLGSQIRYFVDPNQSGRGIATIAVRLMLDELTGSGDIFAFIDPVNIGSIRVAEKAGFELQGEAQIGDKIVYMYKRTI